MIRTSPVRDREQNPRRDAPGRMPSRTDTDHETGLNRPNHAQRVVSADKLLTPSRPNSVPTYCMPRAHILPLRCAPDANCVLPPCTHRAPGVHTRWMHHAPGPSESVKSPRSGQPSYKYNITTTRTPYQRARGNRQRPARHATGHHPNAYT